MAELSSADHGTIPPRITIPRDYNAAHDLIERNLRAGRLDIAVGVAHRSRKHDDSRKTEQPDRNR